MIPNIVYAVRHQNDNADTYRNKKVVVAEQIGRFGCFVLMIFNIPYTYFNFWFDYALIVYLSVNGGLCIAYIIFWIVCGRKPGWLRALSLSILPSCVFLFSGIVFANIPLIVFSVLFAVTHIFISCKNAVPTTRKRRKYTLREKAADDFIMLFLIILVLAVVVGMVYKLILGDDGHGVFPL